jgi:D-3-phosphoglycerate dehydrogenase
MSEWKILLTDGLDESGKAILRGSAVVVDCPDIQADELLQSVGEVDGLIVRGRTKVTPEVFHAGKKLRVVGRAGVGVDNINLEAAKEHGVTVVNAPVSTTLAVAELTIGLMLSLARMIPRADCGIKAGQWLKKQLVGIELNGKVLGIIGMGNIGSAVAQRAAALGMQVIGCDPFISTEELQMRGALPASKDEILAKSDFITIHVPLNDSTRNLVKEETLSKMKPGVRLVCTARGGVIDEPALLQALQKGQVAAVALDVFAKEPPGLTDLVSHPNVIATPHIGAQSEEAQVRASEDISAEVLAVLRGETLRWKIV